VSHGRCWLKNEEKTRRGPRSSLPATSLSSLRGVHRSFNASVRAPRRRGTSRRRRYELAIDRRWHSCTLQPLPSPASDQSRIALAGKKSMLHGARNFHSCSPCRASGRADCRQSRAISRDLATHGDSDVALGTSPALDLPLHAPRERINYTGEPESRRDSGQNTRSRVVPRSAGDIFTKRSATQGVSRLEMARSDRRRPAY